VIARAALSGNALALTIDATPGKTYFIQSGTNLIDWEDVQSIVPSAVRGEYQTPIPGTSRLYRLRVP
jgi:hypothetical protein